MSNFEHFYSKTQRRENGQGDPEQEKEKLAKSNRLKKFLGMLKRRRSTTKSNEELYFDLGQHAGNPTQFNVDNNGNGVESAAGEADAFRVSNV